MTQRLCFARDSYGNIDLTDARRLDGTVHNLRTKLGMGARVHPEIRHAAQVLLTRATNAVRTTNGTCSYEEAARLAAAANPSLLYLSMQGSLPPGSEYDLDLKDAEVT